MSASVRALAVLLAAAFSCAADTCVVTNCARLADLSKGAEGTETRFDVTATVIARSHRTGAILTLLDDSGAVACVDRRAHGAAKISPGDIGRFRGTLLYEKTETYPVIGEFSFIAKGFLPEAKETSPAAFLSGGHDYREVFLRGTVRDTFRDENDPDFVYMPLLCSDTIIYTALESPAGDELKDLIGAQVRARGTCTPLIHGNRRQIGRTLQIGSRKNIAVLRPATEKPFDAPEIGSLRCEHPARIPLLGRRRATGTVRARWDTDRFLLETDRGRIVNIQLADSPLPEWNTCVEVVGFPETDLYRVNLVRAVWRPSSPFCSAGTGKTERAELVSPRQITADPEGRRRIDPTFHGRTVRMRGIVAATPGTDDDRIYLKSGNDIVPVETGRQNLEPSAPVPGAAVEVTGVCVMETENRRPDSVFPRMRGFFLVLSPDDGLRILSLPSWWTSQRLAVVIALLVLTVVAVLLWNRSLKRLAERRGRELADGDIARAEADIRTLERTRLAVELHDSVAQSMNGIAMELKAAERCGEGSSPEMKRHLDIAARTLKSTIGELRNCLWDLRNRSLDEKDFAEAVRRTLLPHVDGAEVSVRFSVPRDRVSENTAHVILRVIRELVINAVRRGKATSVRIAGAIEGDKLRFSVLDNGTGFDPAAHPGVTEGHFGIQGIRERIRPLAGVLSYETAPGCGTKATVTLHMPKEDA